jgi:hypothetical protein
MSSCREPEEAHWRKQSESGSRFQLPISQEHQEDTEYCTLRGPATSRCKERKDRYENAVSCRCQVAWLEFRQFLVRVLLPMIQRSEKMDKEGRVRLIWSIV